MQKNKYKYLLYILIEEKRLESITVKGTKIENRLAEIQEIKASFYQCEVKAVLQFLEEKPNSNTVAKKYAEYYRLQDEKKKIKIREQVRLINEQMEVQMIKRKLKEEKEDDNLLAFLMWMIFSRDGSLIYMITDDLMISSIMLLMANNNNLRIKT